LDALDEVPREHRNRLKDKLNRFVQNYPCQIICTSRIVGYDGAFVNGAKEVEIVPFKQKQTEQYIKIWFTNAADYIDNDLVSANGLIRELQNKPQIRGLAQNPLLLSLLCSLYQEKELTLPARRCQIYEKAVLCMLSKWTRNRKPQSEGKIRAKIRVLEELAYQFTCEGKESFSPDELYDKIEAYLQEGKTTVFRDTNTDELMTELSEEDGIIQKFSSKDDRYLFLHRTFQEYFTACYLKRAIQKNQNDGIALAREHFWEYDWHETLSLLAGLMQEPIPLLQAITAQKDDIFSTLLLLAGRCVAECQENSHSLMAEIIDRIYKFWQSDPYAGFIESIVVAIGQTNSQMLERLQKALKDENYLVRSEAVEALAEIGNLQAVEALLAVCNDEDSNISFLAVDALDALDVICNPQAEEVLIPSCNDEESFVRIQAALALVRTDNPQVEEALINALLNDNDSSVRSNAAKALDGIETPQAEKALATALNDEESVVRIQAALALVRTDNPQVEEVLITALLNDNDSSVRSNAAKALDGIETPQAEEALVAALNDEDSIVRIQAALALVRTGNPQVGKVLIAALNDENNGFRSDAAEALGEIGTSETLANLIQFPEIDIYDPEIFRLARTLAIQFSKEKLPFIPVYPELVAHKP